MTTLRPDVAALRMHAWWVLLVIGGSLVLGYTTTDSVLAENVIYHLIGLASVAALVIGVRTNRPALDAPWRRMALGLGLWVVGDVLYSVHDDVLHSDSYPTVGDIFYLAAYPILAAALFRLSRNRRPEGDTAGSLDGWTVAAGLAFIFYELVIRPTLSGASGPWLPTAVSVLYPLGDILLVTALVRMVTTPGAWNRAGQLLAAGVGLVFTADTASTLLGLYTSADTGWLDPLWLGSYLAWGAAALHPTMTRISEPVTSVDPGFSRRRLVAAGVAVLIAPGMMAVRLVWDRSTGDWAVIVGSVVLLVLVVARMAVAIDQIAEVNRLRLDLQEQLAYEATHDPLTSLANRARGLTLVREALARAAGGGTTTGLLFIDLDGFKHVNDTLGHRTGDEVLTVVASRLVETVRDGDPAIRLGGDEFVVLLEDVGSEHEAVAIARRLIDAISEPIVLPAGTSRVGASIGVTIVAADSGHDADTVLHQADVAAYRAKSGGRGRAEVYDASLRDEGNYRQELELQLRRAIEAGQLVLHYQPIINTITGRVEGFEALVRWEHPEVGLVSPAEFLPIAEGADLICDLDTWVLRQATRQLARWTRALADQRLVVSVNLSPTHVGRSRVVEDVRLAVQSSGIDPRRLVLEVRESVLADVDGAVAHLKALRDFGVAVSIDDFGASFGALAQLADLPVDEVKIDGRYLDVGSSMSDKLLHLMIQGAHAVGLSAVALGVEKDVQLATLRALDCESVQGFHIARPMSADEAEAYHRRQMTKVEGLTLNQSEPQDRVG